MSETPSPPPPSDPCYCVSLRKATRRLSARYDAALAPVGITVAQFSLLRAIRRTPRLSLTDLADRTELDRSTIGRNVRVLEKQALVTLSPGKDARAHLLTLTPTGEDVLARATPLWAAVQTDLAAELGAQNATQLTQLLALL